MSSVGVIMEDTQKLNTIIEQVDDKTQTLATATQEIAASVSTILDTVNEIKKKLEVLGNQ